MAPDTSTRNWEAFRDHAVDWLRQEFGERLRVVLEHADEKAPHLHFAVVPLPGERFSAIHPGKLAAEAAAAGGAVKGVQNAAYKAGMVVWQDRFHAEVASSHGMTRVGPRGKRLTRRDWLTAQSEAESNARLAKAKQAALTHLSIERSTINQGRQSLSVERVAVSEDRKAINTERSVLERHRKAVDADRALVRQHRQSIAGERAAIQQEQEAVQAEWAAIHREQQALHADRTRCERTLATLANDPYFQAAEQLNDLRDQLDQANTRAAQAISQRDALAEQMSKLQNENATLRARLPVEPTARRPAELTRGNRLGG